jgi:FLYWCH zinc finger domain
MNNVMPFTIKYGVTKRGQRTAIHLNYEFWRFKDYVKRRTLWRCSRHQRFHCKAMLMTDDSTVIGNQFPEHTHTANATIKPARKAEVCAAPSMSPINSIEHTNKFILMEPRNVRLPMKEKNWTTLHQKISDAPNSNTTSLIGNLSPEHIHIANINTEHIIRNENVRNTTSVSPTNKIEQSKKYIFVDAQSTRPPLMETNITIFDQAISDTLNSSLSDDIKAMQYIRAVRTFTNYDGPSATSITKDANVIIHHANQYKASNTKYESIDNNNTDRYLNVVKGKKNLKRTKKKKNMKEVKQDLFKVLKKKKNLSKKPKTVYSKWIKY